MSYIRLLARFLRQASNRGTTGAPLESGPRRSLRSGPWPGQATDVDQVAESMLHFFSSRSHDAEYEATAGWYIAPDEELAVPRISPRSRIQQWIHHHSTILRYVVLPLLLVFLVGVELRTSIGQAVVLSSWASTMTYDVQEGSSSRIRYPSHGPYNQRLGYERLPLMLDGLMDRDYEIRGQARMSIPMALSMDLGLYPVYRHKDQAGLDILDHRGQTLFGVRYPGHAYSDPDSIPDMVWQSLLYIENRELLDESHRFKNPAVEWDRFALAAFERLITGGEGPGGSTLTTQLTKVRHSPNGRTDSPVEKLRQMASASLHAYQDGLSTGAERKRIVQEYLNQLPLAATAGHGEVNGLGDGLWAWYGREFPEVNDVLTPVPADSAISSEKMQRRAVAYRQVLSLLLATRSPSTYLVRADGPQELARLTDRYLPLLADAGIISEHLKTVALRTEVTVLSRPPSRPEASYVTRKAANSVRMELLRSLQITNLPALNRLDLSTHTTYDRDVQEAVADVLNRLQDPAYIQEQGLMGERLLRPDHISDVRYSFVLFERRPHANVLRVQADNVEGPFDVNRGSMLELGSTAKVRVLITYLELVERVYETYSGDALDEARALSVPTEDPITRWTIDYLLEHPSATRREVLEAAVDREYAGDPSERFFTGGGVHVFGNFSPETDRQMSIRSAVRHSANLAFVRMMRDVVNFYVVRLPGQAMSDLVHQTEEQREKYLSEFASYEGGIFLRRYFRAYQSEAPQGQLLDALGERHQGSSRRLAWAYRSVFPEARTGAFAEYLRTYASDAARLSNAEIERLYRTSNPTGKSWQDLGYLAGVHPLELWLVAYLHTHPGASYGSVLEASVEVRQSVYQWLFQKGRSVQDRRIRTILEQEAFMQIQEM